jgi:hypothetical protein
LSTKKGFYGSQSCKAYPEKLKGTSSFYNFSYSIGGIDLRRGKSTIVMTERRD